MSFKKRLTQSDFVLPSGYTLEFGGETEQRSQAVNNLIANAIVLFALMLLTLVASFRSFRCAFIIAAVGVMSAGLGPLALEYFRLSVWLHGDRRHDGIGRSGDQRFDRGAGGDSRKRDFLAREMSAEMTNVVADCTRHMITTTLTTIVGFLPLILGGGGFWPPLGDHDRRWRRWGNVVGVVFCSLAVSCAYSKRHPTGPERCSD